MTALSCVLPVALLIAQAQQPETESRPAVVFGRVVDAGSGRPIAGVIVTPAGQASNPPLTPGQVTRQPPRVMTNSSGQFVIRGLKKGSLVLTATMGGYANATHGQRRPGGSTQPIAVNDGDRLTDIEIRMWKHASITGTVVDEAGEAVVGGRVQSFQRVFSGGRRRYSSTASATTDDLGVYRISGLTPGDYSIAMPQMQGTLPSEVSDALLNGNTNDPKRNELMRETIVLGGLMVAPAGSPYVMKVGDQMISLPTGTVAPFAAPNNALMIYPTAFYPAGALPTQAATITLRSGEERSGIDLQVRPSRGLRVSGTIVGPEGPAAHIGVRLSAAAAEDVIDALETAGTVSDANGAFTFPAVPPGQYVLRISRVPRPPLVLDDANRTTMVSAGGGVTITSSGPAGMTPTPPITPDPTLCAQVPVTVGDRDVANLIVSLAPGPRVTGRVEFDGTVEKPSLTSLTNLRIVLEPADGSRLRDSTLFFQTGHPNEDGTFTTYGVPPGRYVVRMPNPPAGWTFKSAMYQGRDLSDTPIDLGARDAAGVVITLTDRPASLAGSVRTGQGPDGEAIVVVYPIDSAAWSSSGVTSRRMRTARAARDGSYSIAGLPAGEYYVVAVKEDMVGEWQDPALLKALAGLAQQVRIIDGERKQQDLTSAVIR
jgi:protocatechuate 3,4-dioxygenase beta subunit